MLLLQRLTLKQICYILTVFSGFLFITAMYRLMQCKLMSKVLLLQEQRLVNSTQRQKNLIFYYDNKSPLIFIGGMPFSGTDIVQLVLDIHPYINCGKQTQIVPSILLTRKYMKRSSTERKWLKNAGITDYVFDSAIKNFILEIIANHGSPAHFLCNADEHVINYSLYLNKLFPNSKFVFLIRDGRTAVMSYLSQNYTKSGYDCVDAQDCLQRWSDKVEYLYAQCLYLGQDRCLPVYFEHLKLYPKLVLKRIYDFIGLPWISSLLYYQRQILNAASPGESGIYQRSSINASEMFDTVFTNDTNNNSKKESVLQKLGYNPDIYPQDYKSLGPNTLGNDTQVQKILQFLRKQNAGN